MKKLIPILLCTLALSAGLLALAKAQEKPKAKITTAPVKTDKMAMPYVAGYSSQFEMADPAKARKVLELWKDYDDNAFDRHKTYFADTVAMYMADGMAIKGLDSLMNKMKAYRGGFASAKSSVDVWMSLRSIDKNENWVAIWGSEEDTGKDGKKTMVHLQEVWRFNKDGKIDLMMQFAAVPSPGQQ